MIRVATTADIPRLLELGASMHKESIYAAHDYDTAKVAELMSTLISVSSGILLVSEEDGVIEGGFMGCVHSHWFGKDLVATDYALFLSPEHRHGSTAARLIKHYILQARSKGAVQITLANSTGVHLEGVARLYGAMGFVKRGYVFELVESV